MQFSLLISLLTLVGCSNGPAKTITSPQKSNLTFGLVKSKLIEGETSQSEILNLFGAPNLTTRNSKKQEVWNYNRMSFESGASQVTSLQLATAHAKRHRS